MADAYMQRDGAGRKQWVGLPILTPLPLPLHLGSGLKAEHVYVYD